jgi:hypothetical protein
MKYPFIDFGKILACESGFVFRAFSGGKVPQPSPLQRQQECHKRQSGTFRTTCLQHALHCFPLRNLGSE